MYDDSPLVVRAGSESTSTRPSLFTMVGAVLGAVRGHRVMRVICVLTLLGALAMMPVVMMWPPRLEALAGGSYWMLGKIWALLNLTAVIGAALAAFLAPRVRRDWLLTVIALWRGAFLAAAAAATAFTPVVGWLLLYEAGVAASEPIKNAWMNEHVRSELRATVLSVQGMCFTLGGALGLVMLGLLARSDDPDGVGRSGGDLHRDRTGLSLARRCRRSWDAAALER
jgi:MFS family permease